MAAAPRFARIAVVVCDSAGVGDAPDAEAFGDAGANTLGHVIAHARPALPNLAGLGLANVPGVDLPPTEASGAWGRLTERGPGKDTMLGHWELTGVLVERDLPLYPDGFPPAVIDRFTRAVGRGVLGNRPASGTAIVEELGDEHVRTGDLIVYTSGDSVFQIAAHERVVPVPELYEICRTTREILQGEHAVGRVIARPFEDGPDGGYRRTSRRKDFPLPPPAATALDWLAAAGVATHAVGKIHDIFAGRGIASATKSADNDAGITATAEALRAHTAPLVFTNLVDFDTDYGHRNDPAGYAAALERLDARVPELLEALGDDGLLILTADHGNDPTWPGTDHTRERVPLLVAGPGVGPGDLGCGDFADLGASLLDNFGLAPAGTIGRSFLDRIPRR